MVSNIFTEEDNQLIYKEFESLREASLKRCATPQEYEEVVKAFEFANEAHKGVRRRSGEPYILHPIAVAKIVVQEIGLGYKSIVAALLHDVVEDTEYTVEDISHLFGDKIASLVDGLTKIKSAMDSSHSEISARETAPGSATAFSAGLPDWTQERSIQAENFKRMLLTLNDDVRVILIKLADRLHNLRTIRFMPERKMDKILSETMYIFIPLAHRLGLYSIKSEMEDIWLQYREPEAYESISRRLNELMVKRQCAIDQFIRPIETVLKEAGYTFTISQRTKSPYSIWKKMQAKNLPFEQIYDLFAVRIIFEPKDNGTTERKQCWDIYSLISEDYQSKLDRIRDWVSTPKSNGYEALHCTLMSHLGNWVEVQIRTVRMNEIAEKGIAAHWSYKGINKSENDLDQWLNKVREVLEDPDANALQLLDKFHDELFSSEIYVFTPKGESRRLPKGSTVLDFAYHIHKEIGNRALAAKVNLKLVPLSHVLKNGDQIEIITAESQKPDRQWLDFVTTPKAKKMIYASLKSDIKNVMKEGQTILETELAKQGVKLQTRVLKKLIAEYGLNNREELYSKIGIGLIDLSGLDKILKKNTENKFVKYWNFQFLNFSGGGEKEQEDKEGKRPEINKKQDYLLQENPLDKTLTYIVAECCRPIPGDAVVGFADDHNQVVIHKKICPRATALASVQGGKIVNVKWAKHSILSFLARIEIKGIDRLGLVNDITQYITFVLSVNIRKIHFETHDGVFEGYIDLYVHNTEDLEMLMKRIQKIKGVESTTRVDIKE